jgi:hypothetical protein
LTQYAGPELLQSESPMQLKRAQPPLHVNPGEHDAVSHASAGWQVRAQSTQFEVSSQLVPARQSAIVVQGTSRLTHVRPHCAAPGGTQTRLIPPHSSASWQQPAGQTLVQLTALVMSEHTNTEPQLQLHDMP